MCSLYGKCEACVFQAEKNLYQWPGLHFCSGYTMYTNVSHRLHHWSVSSRGNKRCGAMHEKGTKDLCTFERVGFFRGVCFKTVYE